MRRKHPIPICTRCGEQINRLLHAITAILPGLMLTNISKGAAWNVATCKPHHNVLIPCVKAHMSDSMVHTLTESGVPKLREPEVMSKK